MIVRFLSPRTWLLLILSIATARGVRAADALEQGFQSPPASARPHTWWHWMNGNVTREGITADLEAMKRVGIGGAQIFNVSEGIPAGPVRFLSPEWRALMKFAAQEADRLGLELCLHNCAGWSSSGGPWNTPAGAMQHVVTSELAVKGPSHFSGVVPQPPTRLDFYRDIAVFAFHTPDGESIRMRSFAPKVSASVENFDGARLIDGNPGTFALLPAPTPKQPQFVQLEFARPFPSRTIALTPGTNLSEVAGRVQVSDDGRTFRDVRAFVVPRRSTQPLLLTLGSEPVSARFYRVEFTGAPEGVREIGPAEIDLSPRLRIENLNAKSGESGAFVAPSVAAAGAAPSLVVERRGLVDLTARLGADGRLDWDVPPGEWTILRAGYTPTGRNNHPAPPEATGLECDKFSTAELDAHWTGFVQKVLDDLGPLAGAGKALNNVLIDSYEVGGQNWSEHFRAEFQQRRGYDPVPFLPALTGRVVDSPQVSERFLWDLRRTIADLFAENYYGHFAELCHARGLAASIEPYTGPFESLQCGAPADLPMGEFWVEGAPHPSVKLAASVGHIYGRSVIGAESFTARPGPRHGRWLDDPYSIKALGDLVFCQGINRYIFHRFAMQPWTNRWPGMTMGQWGTHFDRTSTWWEQSRTWLQYVSRCQFLLQQGRFVADIAYFCGESTPVEMRIGSGDTAPPEGYDYDGINADVLLHHSHVKDGRLVLDSGVSYRILVLPASDRNMTPELLRRLRALVADGLAIVGRFQAASPSLQNYPKCDAEVRELAEQIWGLGRDAELPVETHYFKGRVFIGTLWDALQRIGAQPDFQFTGPENPRLAWIHRSTGDAEIYFVSNQRDQPDAVECSFRIAGKLPELWNAETGRIEPAPVWREEHGRTLVPLRLDPVGSVFVVFRSPAPSEHLTSIQPGLEFAGGQSELKILKAVYGSLDQSLDVTAQVRALVAAGERRVLANNDLAGDDPAFGVVKRLRVEFITAGNRRTAEANENETLELPRQVEILSARYGAPAPAGAPTHSSGSVDITQKLAALSRSNTLSVVVDNALAGADPAPFVPKQLRLEYSVNGAKHQVTIDENATLTLPVASSIGAPAFTVALEGGSPRLWSEAAGRFTLTWASGRRVDALCSVVPAPVSVPGGWRVQFPPNLGAPPEVSLDRLISWSDHSDPGVRYFSGTARYEKEIDIPAERIAGGRELWLELGVVKNIAEVSLNGQSLGTLWKPPFRVRLNGAARAGANHLEIKITNLWPNRLIGDEQLPEDREWNGKRLREWPQWLLDGQPSPTGRFTFTTWHHWTKTDGLLESGLIGPVKLAVMEPVAIP